MCATFIVMSEYTLTVGLEVHAELKTNSKMFCGCTNAPDEHPENALVCPVCMGHPGTLPVVNKEAVRHVLKVGIAVEGTIADYTEFDRKNYFYPDIPKGYQISQYKYPLVSGGSLHGVALERIHLEEDTARSIHDAGDHSLVDFNRAGVPLMELVTKPVIHSAKEAGEFAKELRLLLRYLGASDANMEKGQMRVEANISISNNEKLGTKVEVKNINSFKAVEKAIEFEFIRQQGLLEKGEKVVQETRGWDENRQVTFSQRLKEESHDYRYFPDPDIPKFVLSEIEEFSKSRLSEMLPELPFEKRKRLTSIGIHEDGVETLVQEPELSKFFDAVIKAGADPLLSANYITSDLQSHRKDAPLVTVERALNDPAGFAEIIKMVSDGSLSSRGAKDLLLAWFTEGGSPSAIAKERGMIQQNDEGALVTIVKEVINAHPGPVSEFKAGKEASIQFLVGQAMKASKGAGNPKKLQELLRTELSK